jgi:hypothetical protein
MKRKKPAKYTALLPATPCTSTMRESIEAIAVEQNEGLAEVQRRAFEFFLSKSDKIYSMSKK